MRNYIPFLFLMAADDALQSAGGAIGNVGNFKEEITKDLRVIGSVELAGEKDFLAAIPGALKVKGKLELEIDADPAAVILYEAQKIKNPVADWIAKELLAMRTGAAPSAELAAAHAAATSA